MCLPSVEVVATAGKSAPAPRRSGSGAERWDRMDPGERERRREVVLAEVNAILREGWDALMPLAGDSGTGLDALEVATQALLRQAGGCFRACCANGCWSVKDPHPSAPVARTEWNARCARVSSRGCVIPPASRAVVTAVGSAT